MKRVLIFAVLASLASCRDQAAEMEVAKQGIGIAKDLSSVQAGGANGIEALLAGMGR